MKITLNGAEHHLDAPVSVAELLAGMSLEGVAPAVERNAEIVPPALYAATQLAEGDVLEILDFVGGG